ncbi:Glycosyl hydrolases family 6 [Seinonella peptonophila]|uniref:Glucanase n=1 Tax=Seinonella peptonophila TaxID=112248 RepID=A0A1M5A6R5_9BACL|nr:glycoside hydrolase family 6 protein [Seinonella peptonophila]SHF25844.1 Glycosyl hydrolases family 6 [Seinonella peptonophila]
MPIKLRINNPPKQKNDPFLLEHPDVSRNDNGANGEWCNPPRRKLGIHPTTHPNNGADALLWIQRPGEQIVIVILVKEQKQVNFHLI